MEQNLNEPERSRRLHLGLVAAAIGGALLWLRGPGPAAAVLLALAIGFIANYVTCFCAMKRLLRRVAGVEADGDPD